MILKKIKDARDNLQTNAFKYQLTEKNGQKLKYFLVEGEVQGALREKQRE
jgi:hypothetical protein